MWRLLHRSFCLSLGSSATSWTIRKHKIWVLPCVTVSNITHVTSNMTYVMPVTWYRSNVYHAINLIIRKQQIHTMSSECVKLFDWKVIFSQQSYLTDLPAIQLIKGWGLHKENSNYNLGKMKPNRNCYDFSVSIHTFLTCWHTID